MKIFTIYNWSGAKIIMVTPTIHFSDDSISTQSQSWTQEVVLLTEQNNNNGPEPSTMFKHLETLETTIIDILEPKDPPKKIMRIDNGYRNRWLSSQSPQSLTFRTLSSIPVISTLWFRYEHVLDLVLKLINCWSDWMTKVKYIFLDLHTLNPFLMRFLSNPSKKTQITENLYYEAITSDKCGNRLYQAFPCALNHSLF